MFPDPVLTAESCATLVSNASPLPMPSVARRAVLPDVMLTEAPFPSVRPPATLVSETSCPAATIPVDDAFRLDDTIPIERLLASV